jgi:hypothetical protein
MQTPGSNGQKADVLVALTPFHYYLEPWLQKLGAVRVAELPRIRLREEPEGTAGSFMRLLRMKGLKAADLDKAREAGLYRFSAEELSMPERASLLVPSGQVWRSELIKVVEDYEAHPRDWKPLHKVEFKLSDPWFWTLLGSLPGGIGFPMRLKCAMEVEIPKDGDYAFGASSTPSIWVKLDGKQVFRHLQGQECDETMREGRLGDPVPLKAGKHRLELEQAWLSPHGNFQHSLRLVWRAPAGELETLPLSSIRPL